MPLLFEYHETVVDRNASAKLLNHIASGLSVYVNFHNPFNSRALNFAASSTFYFTPYDDANHVDFCGELDESSDRSKYHFLSIPVGSVVIPDTEYGQHYVTEYWVQAASGTKNRDTDDLLLTERWYWRDNRRCGAFLDLSQEESIGMQAWKQLQAALELEPADSAAGILLDIQSKTAGLSDDPASARYEALCSLSYDDATQRIGFTAWLEKDGELQIDAKSASVQLYDSSDALIASAASAAPDSVGQFNAEAIGIPLSPDESYFLKVTIVDVDDINRIGGEGVTSWD